MNAHPPDDIESVQSESATDDEAMREPGPQRPLLNNVVLIAAALTAALGAYVLFVPAPRVPLGVLTATADEREASGYRQEGEVSGGAAASAAASVLQSNRNVTSAKSSAHSNGWKVFDRTLAIFNRDDDLLMQRVGLALFEKLRDDGRFEQIRYYPAGERPADGELLPEAFVTLQEMSWDEGGLPGRRTFEGKLVVTARDQYLKSSSSYIGTLSPPQVPFRWRAELDYTATQTGVETSGARYEQVSVDVAKEFAAPLTKMLDELVSKYGAAAALPELFYPEYAKPPAFDFLAALDAEKLVDGRQLMRSTVAVWRVANDRNPEDVVDLVRQSLAADGWKLPEESTRSQYLRATDGAQIIEVFREDDGFGAGDEHTSPPPPMCIVYTRGMSEEEIHAGVRQMFEDGVDEEALVMFQKAWHQHAELVEQYFRERRPSDPDSWLQLAHLRQKSQPEAAKEALLRANALQRILHHEAPDASMKKLAEELGIELPQQVSHGMVQSLGLSELDEPGEVELTVRENELAAIWLGGAGDQQSWLLLTPIRQRGIVPERTLKVERLTLWDGGWSHAEETGRDLLNPDRPVVTQHVGDGDPIEIFSRPGDDGKAYHLTVRRTSP